VHARRGKEHCGVILGQQRSRTHYGMLFLLEEFQVLLSQFVSEHLVSPACRNNGFSLSILELILMVLMPVSSQGTADFYLSIKPAGVILYFISLDCSHGNLLMKPRNLSLLTMSALLF